MKGTARIVKGRIEEAAGALVGNDQLRAEGQRDQVVGQVRQTAEKSVKEGEASARKIVDQARGVARKAADKA